MGAEGVDFLQSLMLCPQAATVAVAENDATQLRDVADRFHIGRSYVDYRELLDQPDIDAVAIALPNRQRVPVAIAALEARKHSLMAAPLASNGKEASRIIPLAQKMRRTVMVGAPMRFNRHTQWARAAVQHGDLGEVYHARAFWRSRSGFAQTDSGLTGKDHAGGGCLYHLGAPILDACLHLLHDFDVASVSGQTFAKFAARVSNNGKPAQANSAAVKPLDVEDYGVALIKLKSGRTVTLEVSWTAFQPDDPREFGIDLLGTEGGLSLFPARLHRNGPLGLETIQLAESHLPHPENPIHHFVECALHGRKPIIPLAESLRLQQILDAVFLSAQTGKEVRLK